MRLLFKSILTCGLILLSLASKSQILIQNFNSGIPVSWAQNPAASWSINPTFGASGSGCAITQDLTMATPTISLRTQTLNLSSATNLTITFKVALTKNNFISPNIALFYDSGLGSQFIARWGSGFSSNTTYTVSDASDYVPPLDPENVFWFNCTHTLSAISGSIVSFVFDAEIVNGGYVLIDDLVVSGIVPATTNITKLLLPESIVLYPNPTDKIIMLEGWPPTNLILMDELGKILPVDSAKINETTTSLDLGNLPAGIYYLTTVTEGKEPVRRKIIVQ